MSFTRIVANPKGKLEMVPVQLPRDVRPTKEEQADAALQAAAEARSQLGELMPVADLDQPVQSTPRKRGKP